MATGFTVTATGALVAATAKSAASVTSAATRGATLTALDVSFDGVSASAVPVKVELCASTQATAGTSTAFTPLLLRGDPAEAAQSAAGVNYTAEPTVLTVLRTWYVSPTSGMGVQFPLGREVVGTAAAGSARKALVLRLTAPAAVNYAAALEFEE